MKPNLAKASYGWSPLQLHHKTEKRKPCMQARVEGLVQLRVSFSGEVLPNFYLKIRISTYTKVFQGKKRPKFTRFWKEKKIRSPDCYDKFQEVAKNIEGSRFFFFLISYLGYSKIWLNYFLDDCHFGYITKSIKETLVQLKDSICFKWVQIGF
jgi:hypothetical protein